MALRRGRQDGVARGWLGHVDRRTKLEHRAAIAGRDAVIVNVLVADGQWLGQRGGRR